MGPAPDFDKSSFRNVKDSLGLDFPNLPYYIDGKVVSKVRLADREPEQILMLCTI